MLELLALGEYNAGQMGRDELAEVPGLETSDQLDAFLHERGIGTRPGSGGVASEGLTRTAATDLVARFEAFSADKTLGGLDPVILIREGRR